MRTGLLIAGGLAVVVAVILLHGGVHQSAHPGAVVASGALSPTVAAPSASPAGPGVPGERVATTPQLAPEEPSVAAGAGQPPAIKPIIGDAEARASHAQFKASRKEEKRAWKRARAKDPTLTHSEFRSAWLKQQNEQSP
jgi:hypothetical protein